MKLDSKNFRLKFRSHFKKSNVCLSDKIVKENTTDGKVHLDTSIILPTFKIFDQTFDFTFE